MVVDGFETAELRTPMLTIYPREIMGEIFSRRFFVDGILASVILLFQIRTRPLF